MREVVMDDRINIFCEKVSDVIFLGVDIVVDFSNALSGVFISILNDVFDLGDESMNFVSHFLNNEFWEMMWGSN